MLLVVTHRKQREQERQRLERRQQALAQRRTAASHYAHAIMRRCVLAPLAHAVAAAR